MSEAEQAQHQLDAIWNAIAAVKLAAEEERKITHAKHLDPHYLEAINRLELKQASLLSYAYRVQTLGR